MPNPDFIGNVPAKRCETCKSWLRWGPRDGGLESRMGWCDKHFCHDGQGPIQAHTTDLTACSDWNPKGEGEHDSD